MKPESPVVQGFEAHEVNIAESQDEYMTLPAIVCGDGQVISRWKMGWKERFRAFLTGNIYLHVHTFGRPLQPVLVSTEKPELSSGES